MINQQNIKPARINFYLLYQNKMSLFIFFVSSLHFHHLFSINFYQYQAMSDPPDTWEEVDYSSSSQSTSQPNSQSSWFYLPEVSSSTFVSGSFLLGQQKHFLKTFCFFLLLQPITQESLISINIQTQSQRRNDTPTSSQLRFSTPTPSQRNTFQSPSSQMGFSIPAASSQRNIFPPMSRQISFSIPGASSQRGGVTTQISSQRGATTPTSSQIGVTTPTSTQRSATTPTSSQHNVQHNRFDQNAEYDALMDIYNLSPPHLFSSDDEFSITSSVDDHDEQEEYMTPVAPRVVVEQDENTPPATPTTTPTVSRRVVATHIFTRSGGNSREQGIVEEARQSESSSSSISSNRTMTTVPRAGETPEHSAPRGTIYETATDALRAFTGPATARRSSRNRQHDRSSRSNRN
jgi:hypothetical protein